jgi:predicted nuclease of restriction endonuclease-like (RecB) superfamily
MAEKRSTRKPARPAAARPASRRGKALDYGVLVGAIASAHRDLQGRAAMAVNQALVLRNWLVGAYLVEYEQGGKDRAEYGARLLERLATDLAAKGVKGLDTRTLRDCRQLFVCYPQIRGTLSPEFAARLGLPAIRQTPSGELAPAVEGGPTPEIASGKSVDTVDQIPAVPSGREPSRLPVPLSPERVLGLCWSKLVEFIAVDDPWKRAFYENECLKGNWSVRQLQRQIESLLYERTGLSTDKAGVLRRAQRQEPQETVEDLIRDPYVLEFTGIEERPQHSESDLETALLDHLQRFLLELGTGFCFEARQFRITVNRKHDRVDLVFYHRVLRCHVLIELKIRVFRHADAGQMNFYLNWFKAHMVGEGDNPPVGILLCSDRDGTEVEFATAGMDNRLFVSRYLTALPSAEQLKTLVDRDRAEIETGRAPTP